MGDSESTILEPGIYVLRNLQSNSIMDLSGGDNKSIIGFPWHGLENQQWEFGTLGDGWYIRSVHTGKYLNIEKGLGEGFLIVANGYPTAWVIEDEREAGVDIFRISWPNTPYCFDMHNGDITPGTKVNLRSRSTEARNQMWQIQRISEEQNVSEVATATEVSTPEMVTTTTNTTTTTVTTTVVTRRNGVVVSEGRY